MTTTRHKLFTPGPTPIPEQVMHLMNESIIHHRGHEFSRIFSRVSQDLKYLFQTEYDVLTLTTSGTGGMEAVVANLLCRSDRVLTVNAGKFGARWADICRAYGVDFIEIEKQWGHAVHPDEIVDYLKQYPKIKAVFLTHNETSTGVTIDLKSISEAIHANSDALVVVDCISAIGGIPLKMDAWNLDVVITASQKGLMLPPGLAFVALNDRGWKAAAKSDLPKFYLSLKAARDSLKKDSTPFTPATTIIRGLEAALSMIKEKTLERLWFEHQVFGDAVRAAIRALGLSLLSRQPSNALTAVIVPEQLSCKAIISGLEQNFGIIVSGGQGHLKDKIFRIGHIGFYDISDIIGIISALEIVLKSSGWQFEIGAGICSAQQILQQLSVRKQS
ncbi:alanine--glyoxylate aminotransferase family protein [candidate division KSB1 bacterium]|nr:alanine--glyoxylate aminotransferase family protein [candidate division KSB1 bacterium]